jgi:DNA-binding response OmpR family regulator
MNNIYDKQSILIVDDKPENLFALEQVLKKLGPEIIKASSGNEALALTLNHVFALILLDVRMPEMDGYEVAETLRGEEKTKDTPIIFLTASYTDDSQSLKGYDVGAVDYIVKPINPTILISKVRVFLELNRKENEHKKLIKDLSLALDKVKTLSGLLPICSSCKKIRDDSGYWQQVEVYIRNHTEADFSHSLCPVCAKKLYPEFYDKIYSDE